MTVLTLLVQSFSHFVAIPGTFNANHPGSINVVCPILWVHSAMEFVSNPILPTCINVIFTLKLMGFYIFNLSDNSFII